MKVIEILRETTGQNVYVIGDSIAVGIKSAGNAEGKAVGAQNSSTVLGYVKDFVQSGKAKGATVILSTGASNSTYERANGEKKQLDMSPINQQLKLLQDAGATVALVGTGSKRSTVVPGSGGISYFVNFEDQQVNEKLASAATNYGATFLGPLEDYDPGMSNISKGKGVPDGVHPYNGYGKLFHAGSAIAPTKQKVKSDDDTPLGFIKSAYNKVTGALLGAFVIHTPSSNRSPDVADLQKGLVALGFDLPKYGIDGIRGSETSGAIAKFQQANGIKPTGIPGDDTVEKLNSILKDKPELLAKLKKSTMADVKVRSVGGGDDTASVGDLLNSDDPEVQKARTISEKYLGRSLSDEEWTALIKVTAAEENTVDGCGHVLAAILNRTRSGRYGNTLVGVVTAKRQFQPVSGVSGNENHLASLPIRNLKLISRAAIQVLPNVDHNIVNFTSNIDAAYQGRPSIKYKHDLLAKGGEVHGNSIFATA
jgi:peptidoglycan hydrolase-like protein with peptidoglycan-binding domain